MTRLLRLELQWRDSFSRYRWKYYGPNRIAKLPPVLGQAVLATFEKSLTHIEFVEFTERTLNDFMSLSTLVVYCNVVEGTLAITVHTFKDRFVD